MTLISDFGFAAPPLGPSSTVIVVSIFAAISSERAQIQLRHRIAIGFSSLIHGVQGHPLLGPSPALIVVSPLPLTSPAPPPLTSANPY
jgi:hypothetical protein